MNFSIDFTRKSDIARIAAISVFRVKFNVEFTRQAVNFSIEVLFRIAYWPKQKNNNLEPFPKSIFLQSHSIFDHDSSTKVNFEGKGVLLVIEQESQCGSTYWTNQWCEFMRRCAKQLYQLNWFLEKLS